MLPAGVLMLVVNEVIQTVFVAHEGCLSTLESRLKREGGREKQRRRNAECSNVWPDERRSPR